MKIRIRGNSVRLRLTKTEVETLCKTWSYTEQTQFVSSVFTYSLQGKEGIENLDAAFEHDTITVFVPADFLKDWATSSQVGFRNHVSLKNGQKLSILVEKDFTCLDETEEDQSDNYPNPRLM